MRAPARAALLGGVLAGLLGIGAEQAAASYTGQVQTGRRVGGVHQGLGPRAVDARLTAAVVLEDERRVGVEPDGRAALADALVVAPRDVEGLAAARRIFG